MTYDLPHKNLTAPLRKKLKTSLRIAGIAGVFATGLLSVTIIAGVAEEKEKVAWENYLTDAAKRQSDNITHWLENQNSIVYDITSNVALQIYMTELATGNGARERVMDEPVQQIFIQNLLDATAKREGFEQGGITLLDKENRLIAATGNTANNAAKLSDIAAPQLIGPYSNEAGESFITFAAPVFNVQSDATPENQIGTVISVRNINALAPLLRKAPAKETSLEPILVRQSGNNVDAYLADKKGSQIEAKHFLVNKEQLGVVTSIKTPNRLLKRKDFMANDVLVAAAKVKESDWYLVQQVSYQEAMQPANTIKLLTLILYTTAFVLLLTTALFAAKARNTIIYKNRAKRYQDGLEKFSDQKEKLSTILDSLPLAVHFTDRISNYSYSNHKAILPDSGFTASQVSKYYLDLWKNRVKSEPITALSYQGNKIIKATHIPVEALEDELTSISGILSVEEDITADYTETYVLQQIVNMLHILSEARVESMKSWGQKIADNCKTLASNERERKLLWTD